MQGSRDTKIFLDTLYKFDHEAQPRIIASLKSTKSISHYCGRYFDLREGTLLTYSS